MDEKQSLTDVLLFIAALIAIGILGGAARAFVEWSMRPRPFVSVIGQILTSMLASVIVGIMVREATDMYPNLAFSLAGLGAWAGIEVLDLLAKILKKKLTRYLT